PLEPIHHVRGHEAVVGDGAVVIERDRGEAHGTNSFLAGSALHHPQKDPAPVGKSRKRRRATIGIDIGGTKSLYALFDEDFEILAEEKLPTDPGEGGIGAFDRGLRKSVKALAKECKRRDYRLVAVGAGFAGLVNMRKGTIRTAPNLKFLEGYA